MQYLTKLTQKQDNFVEMAWGVLMQNDKKKSNCICLSEINTLLTKLMDTWNGDSYCGICSKEIEAYSYGAKFEIYIDYKSFKRLFSLKKRNMQ